MPTATKPVMRHCPDCKAPNPQSRTTCYACGVSLNKMNPNAVRPGESTYPCANCGGATPYRATSCLHCGREISNTPPESGLTKPIPLIDQKKMLAVIPDGWAAEMLPDGTTRLARSEWWRRGTPHLGSGVLGAIMIAVVIFMRTFHSSGRIGDTGGTDWVEWAILGLFCTIALVGLIVLIFLKEEIRVAPGRLEIWRELGGRVWRSGIEGSAVLRINTSDRRGSKGGRWWERTLRAENLGQKFTITYATHSQSLFGDLFADKSFAYDEPSLMGAYLAGITGWPLIDPAMNRF